MKPSAILTTALFLSACGVARPVLEQDNTKVEVFTREVPVIDTAHFDLPLESEKVATLDTCSVLENSVARSSAVVSGGVLHHSLETLPVTLKAPVESKVVYRDSIVFRDRLQTVIKEVEKPLSRWQQTKLRAGGVCILMALIAVLYLIISFIHNLNPFKL